VIIVGLGVVTSSGMAPPETYDERVKIISAGTFSDRDRGVRKRVSTSTRQRHSARAWHVRVRGDPEVFPDMTETAFPAVSMFGEEGRGLQHSTR